jgi:hypothetical protein
MKFTTTARLAALLLFGAMLALPAVADKGAHGNGNKKDGPAKSASPGKNHPQADPHGAKKWQQERGWQKNGAWPGNDKWNGHRAHHWKDEHRTWHQRGGYRGYRIGQVAYSQHFGPGHAFRLQTRPVLYGGYPRFHHQGHSFLLVDPYPETWKYNWYETDDVYVAYDNGYYLYNRHRPGYPLAVTVIR